MGSIKLARVDERLVHGQVMTNLSKLSGANSIFIVDDEVAKDDFMKTIFKSSGSRTGLTTKIFSADDAIAYWNEKEFEKFDAILLTKDINTVFKIIEAGLPITELNLGGIAKRPTTTYVINQVAIDKEQAEKLKILRDKYNVVVYFQSIPSSQRVELEEALKLFD